MPDATPDSTTDPAATPEAIVAKLFGLNAEISKLLENYLDLESQLIKCGAGKYSDGEGHELQVVGARAAGAGSTTTSFELKPEHEAKARELAGEDKLFKKLFNRVVSYTAVEGFAPVTAALLTPAKARDLCDLCRVETFHKGASGAAAYVLGVDKIWQKKSKK